MNMHIQHIVCLLNSFAQPKDNCIYVSPGYGRPFHQRCQQYSGRNEQDQQVTTTRKSENATLEYEKKLNGERHQGEAAQKNRPSLPYVRCHFILHPQQPNDKQFRTLSLNEFFVPSHLV